MSYSLWAKIKQFREFNDLNQEQLAEQLGVSRPTLTLIESDKRSLKAQELAKLADIFGTTMESITSNKTDPSSIAPEQKSRFKQLIIYILSRVWSKYNVGKTVLYKLLYFAEFDYYELTGEHISWYPFIKLPQWPAPLDFDFLVQEMKRKNEILTVTAKYKKYHQQRFIPNIPSDLEDALSSDQLSVIDEVLERYSDYNAHDISEESHRDKPRQLVNNMDVIGYDLVKFREYPHSPRARLEKKDQAQTEAMNSWFFDDLAHEEDLYEDYR